MVAIGLFIRLRILESPAFRRIRESGTEARMPLVEVFKNYPRQIAIVAGAYLSINVTFYILISFVLTYGTEILGLERNLLTGIVIITSVVGFFGLPVAGALSDRFGRKALILAGTAGMGIFSFALYPLLDTRSYPLMLLGHLIVTVAL